MLIEMILFLFLGMLFGTFTGLIPGIHINLIGAIIVSIISTLLNFINPIYLVVLISSMAITHTFLDFIPSIFLGCPDTDTELSILPGHELLKKGRGYEAILLTAYGGLASILILVFLFFISFLVLNRIYFFLQGIMAYILIFVVFLLISIEKNKLSAITIFLLSGVLGLIVLGVGFSKIPYLTGINIKEPLLPLLTGLFGASMLILTIKTKTQIPKQKIKKIKIGKKIFPPLFGALIASPISSLLPGLGSGQAAVIGNVISRTNRQGFLILIGATNTLVMGFSFVTLYLVSKTRTGAAVAINTIIGNFPLQILFVILGTIILSGIFSFFLTIFLGKVFSKKIEKINYTKLSLITLLILIVIVFVISGFIGLIVFAVSTITGIFCISLKARRTNMMGCLLLPTIIFYLAL